MGSVPGSAPNDRVISEQMAAGTRWRGPLGRDQLFFLVEGLGNFLQSPELPALFVGRLRGLRSDVKILEDLPQHKSGDYWANGSFWRLLLCSVKQRMRGDRPWELHKPACWT